METMVAAGVGPHVKVKVNPSLADPSMVSVNWIGQVDEMGDGCKVGVSDVVLLLGGSAKTTAASV